MQPFTFAIAAEIQFGRGRAAAAAEVVTRYGSSVLLVHGASIERAKWLLDDLTRQGAQVACIGCDGEPSLGMVQQALNRLRGDLPAVVVSLGGGAAIDLGKALAALLPATGEPLDHLEGVGKGLPLIHPPLPFVAIPTTAGTGAEVTKNAVISVPGTDAASQGTKVSLRDPRMIPDVAIVDSTLMQGAPRAVILAAGLDAITQVIEPYVSRRANPMTDAICRAAIPVGLASLKSLMQEETADNWDAMAWTSLCGGLALANAGLGAVHGLAGVIGGVTGAAHGAICGALLPHVLTANLKAAEPGSQASKRLSWIMGLIEETLPGAHAGSGSKRLQDWAQSNGLQSLGQLGVPKSLYRLIATQSENASSMQTNPVRLATADLVEIMANAAQ